MRISDWSSDVCSSDLVALHLLLHSITHRLTFGLGHGAVLICIHFCKNLQRLGLEFGLRDHTILVGVCLSQHPTMHDVMEPATEVLAVRIAGLGVASVALGHTVLPLVPAILLGRLHLSKADLPVAILVRVRETLFQPRIAVGV